MLEVQTEVFAGPLDLLLTLIEKEGFDITAVSLIEVTDQYIAALHAGDGIDLRELAEFVAVGAKLLLLKSRALLPRSATQVEEDETEADEIARDLTERLEEYREFKEAAAYLRTLDEAGHRSFTRVAPLPDGWLPTGLEKVTLRKLVQTLTKALERLPATPEPERLQRVVINVAARRESLLRAIQANGVLPFGRLLAECRSRLEAIVSFMALLDLLKTDDVEAEQSEAFGDILLRATGRVEAGTASA